LLFPNLFGNKVSEKKDVKVESRGEKNKWLLTDKYSINIR